MPGMKKNNAQNVSAHTSPHVEHATHKNTGDINYGTITNQTIHGDPNTYVVPHEDLGLLESMSAWIVGKFGEKKPLVIAIISVILGMFQILTDLGNFVLSSIVDISARTHDGALRTMLPFPFKSYSNVGCCGPATVARVFRSVSEYAYAYAS